MASGVSDQSRHHQSQVATAKSSELANTDDPKAQEVLNERQMEERYLQKLSYEAAHPVQPEGPRNMRMIGRGLRHPKPAPFAQLEGRVALQQPDDELGGLTEFYLGWRYASIDGIDIYDWRNPLGKMFFEPTHDQVVRRYAAGVRRFQHDDQNVIVDFVDDVLVDNPPNPLFGRTPAAVSPPEPAPIDPVNHSGEHSSPPTTTEQADGGKPREAGNRRFLRAEELLRRQIQAPRKMRLEPVLSTLQPDQYRLITATGRANMIIEGGPGTGRSIIASHRAAYLAYDQLSAEDAVDGSILVVGPTKLHIDHIGGVVTQLARDSSRVGFLALPELPPSSPDLPDEISHALAIHTVRTGMSLEALIKHARNRLTGGRDTHVTTAQIMRYLSSGPIALHPTPKEKPWVKYFQSLPSYEQAQRTAMFRPLLAAIEKVLTTPQDNVLPEDLSPIEHVVVDEAQDVTPEEWQTLRKLNVHGSWTILGDLDQRRADKTFKRWSEVVEVLKLSTNTEVVRLQRGYRSTVPILNCANFLLADKAPRPIALQTEGPEVKFQDCTREFLLRTVMREVDQLLSDYPSGTVGVISTMPGSIAEQLKGDASRDRAQAISANDARGLEFDAVIVVEPIDFPRNAERYGLLYTALTRANRELVVVHAKDLPPPLAKYRRARSEQSERANRPSAAGRRRPNRGVY